MRQIVAEVKKYQIKKGRIDRPYSQKYEIDIFLSFKKINHT